MTSKVEISGVNTYDLPLLTSKEMKELFQKAKAGDKDAREELVKGNLRLVLSILQRFKNRGENADDLFQVGCVGLLKAIDNFSLEHNVEFSTYAVPMILGEIKRYLRDNNAVHISRSLKNLSQKIQQTRERLTAQKGREPTLHELAADLNLTPEEVIMGFNASYEPLSFYEPVYQDSDDSLFVMDMISDSKNNAESWLEQVILDEAMRRLTPRERLILKARFFQGKTQVEIAEKIGISQAQVSRIEKAALKQVKNCYLKGEAAANER